MENVLHSARAALATPAVLAWIPVLSLGALLFWRRWLSPIADVPGPAWASLTRLWHMWEILRGGQNKTIEQLHDQHGHFVRIAPNEVSVTHPEAIKKLILAPHRKGQWYAMLRFPDYRFRAAISVVDPHEKSELSRQLASAYTMSNIIKSETQISSLIGRLLDWMDRYAESRKPMDLAGFFTFLAFDGVGEVIFSKPFGFIEQGVDIDGCIGQIVDFEAYISSMAFMQWLHWLLVANPLVTWLDILPAMHTIKTAEAALAARLQNDAGARFDYVAHWLKTHREKPDKLSYWDVQGAVISNVGAGSDTVSAALQSFVYHMIRHPNAWGRLRQEIDGAVAQGKCRDRVVSYADTQNLPFLQACFKESLRIFHPVTMGTPRVAPKGGITIDGHHFPAGTTLSLNTYCMNLSTAVWGPDAKEFKPERWMVDDSTALDKRFLPFSAGIGVCVGQHLARLEIFKTVATIVRDYDIRQVDPKQEWSYKAYFTSVPGDWPVYVEKRKRD